MLKTENHSTSYNSFFLNLLPIWLLIALTSLDFLSHIPLGGDFSNRRLDSNLWQSNHNITNAIFYVIGIWSLTKLLLNPKNLRSLLNPIVLCFLLYCAVLFVSLSFNWPFKLPAWDKSETYPITMVLRLVSFFLAIAAMYSSSYISNNSPSQRKLVKNAWNIILAFFTIRLCIVWIQSFILKFPSNSADPATQTQAFVTKQLALLFEGRLFYPIRAQGLDFPFLYGPLNANESATLGIILFSIAIIRLFNSRTNWVVGFRQLIWLAILLLGLVTILFTQSSAALVLLVIAIPLILIMNGRADVIAIALFLITAVALFFDEPIQNRVSNYVSRGESIVQRVSDLGGRRYIWRKALTHIDDKPLFGHGYETNRFVIGRPLKDIEPYNDPSVQHAHNTYLSVLVENGIVGLVPLLLAIGMLWYSCLNKLRESKFSSLSQEMLLLLLIMSISSLVYIGFFNSILIIYRWLMLIPLLLFSMSPTISFGITEKNIANDKILQNQT